MSLYALADQMAAKGRNGDSVLVHMTPGEVQGLQALAMAGGGSLTINPETGLPEANFLKKLLPAIAGFALGPAGFGLFSSSLGAAAAVGGVEALRTGSLSRGLVAGRHDLAAQPTPRADGLRGRVTADPSPPAARA